MFEGVELGTEATRTSILETAIRSKYISLKGNTYRILPDGEYLVETLNALHINMSKEKTAELGRALKQVYHGKTAISAAVSQAYHEVSDCFAAASDVTLSSRPRTSQAEQSSTSAPIGKCPKCGSDVVERQRLFGCSNRDCRFVLWKQDKYFGSMGKTITKTVAKNLLANGKTAMKGCTSKKTGKTFDCMIQADFSGDYPKYERSFPSRKHDTQSNKTVF